MHLLWRKEEKKRYIIDNQSRTVCIRISLFTRLLLHLPARSLVRNKILNVPLVSISKYMEIMHTWYYECSTLLKRMHEFGKKTDNTRTLVGEVLIFGKYLLAPLQKKKKQQQKKTQKKNTTKKKNHNNKKKTQKKPPQTTRC